MLHTLYSVLLPFFVSLLIAYILDPIVGFVQNKCRVRNRALSVIITLSVIISFVVGCIWILTPVLVREVRSAGTSIEEYISNFDVDRYISQENQKKIRIWVENVNMKEIMSYPEVRDTVKKILPKLLEWISGGLSWLAELVVLVIGFMYLVFLMIRFPKIREKWSDYLPEKIRPYAITLFRDVKHNMNLYFRGQALVALIVGLLFSIGFEIIGMPMGIVMGLIIGVLNLVPYMQVLGIPPCIILCIVQASQTGGSAWIMLGLLALVFLTVQAIQDFVLTPKIMGKVTGMGPAGILLSLSVWGALFGVIGMIIALPMTTLIISYYKNYILKK